MRSFLWLLFVLGCCFTPACRKADLAGALVPPTADQDTRLPQISIKVAGHTRRIHLQTFGDPRNTPLLVLPGGPGADFRLLLPLKALANHFYVIMWDPRGAGLSERVTKAELTLASFNAEIQQVKMRYALDRKVALLGHSFGGMLMVQYTATHPENVKKLILIEPGKLDASLKWTANGGNINFLDGQDFFWQNELLSSKDHAQADYKAIEVLRASSRNWTCDHTIIERYPFWRFGAYHYYIVQKNRARLPKNHNWAAGIAQYQGPIFIIAGSCGALSASFQKKTNLRTLQRASLLTLPGANHITLFTDYAAQTIQAVRKALQH